MSVGEGVGLDEARELAVRAELDRLLESSVFRTSKRCREFLEYVVKHTLTGQSGSLKERSLGVELFRLPTDFDPGQHTIVRVTANEVRKKLAQYYLSENGSCHPVRIDLPPGSYRADFRWEPVVVAPPAEVAAESVPDDPPAAEAISEVELAVVEPPHAQASRFTLKVVACAAAALLVPLALWWWGHAKPVSAVAKSRPVALGAPAGALPRGEDLRMIVGSTNSFVDRSGRAWGPDRFFSGGAVIFRPSERIFRTLDPDIYRRLRQGDFRYDIPLQPGTYELHLHFAETGLADFISAESSGEGQRLFSVNANGKPILVPFDTVADAAGSNVADERVFRDISPAEDGVLHLSLTAIRGSAMLSAIEVLPVSAGKVRPVRIRAGWTSSWQDPSGQEWQADSYFLGGNALVRTTNPAQAANSVTPGMALYASERWGHFSYAVPVADGRYRVTLKFCEGHYGRHNTGVGGLASRVFDVYCNGVALLRGFDIFREAGGEGRPLNKVFSGLRPNAQGKIILTFVPTTGMACVNGIEAVEDAK